MGGEEGGSRAGLVSAVMHYELLHRCVYLAASQITK